jgi:replication factor C subunit 1
MPFVKASNVIAPQKTPKSVPDLEEAIEEDDDGELLIDEAGDVEDEDVDIMKDKYIKKAKAKKDDGAQRPAPKKAKKGAESKVDSDEGSGEEVKPKTSRAGKARGRATKGKAKK